MTENTLREAENKVVIEGVLLEIRHQEWKSKDGLNIELDIEVAENEVHTVKGMSKYKKNDGSENGIAKGYQTIINDYKSVASVGREEADKVRVTQGKIGLNEYFGQDGQLRSYPELSTNFVNRIQASDTYDPKAEFEAEVVVKTIIEEYKNDEETGRVKLTGFIPLYGGKVIPFDFVVGGEGAEYIQGNYEPGQTVKLFGKIVNFKEVKETEVEVAFGKPQKKTTSKTIREYLITGGLDPYEEENVLTYKIDTIKKALTEREVYLEEMKNKNNNTSSKPNDEKPAFGGKSNNKKPAMPF